MQANTPEPVVPLTDREQRLLAQIEAGLLIDHDGHSGLPRPVAVRQWPAILGLIVLVAVYALSIQAGLTVTTAAVLLGSIVRIHQHTRPELPPSS